MLRRTYRRRFQSPPAGLEQPQSLASQRRAAASAASWPARALAANSATASSSSRRTRSSLRRWSRRRGRGPAPPPPRAVRRGRKTRRRPCRRGRRKLTCRHRSVPFASAWRGVRGDTSASPASAAAPYTRPHDPGHRRRRLHRLQSQAALRARGGETIVVRPATRCTGKWRNLRQATSSRTHHATRTELRRHLADHGPRSRWSFIWARSAATAATRRRPAPAATNVDSRSRTVDMVRRARRALRLCFIGRHLWRRRQQGFEDDAAPDGAGATAAAEACTAGPSTPSTCASKRRASGGAGAPPQWAGLKFFNVYGPNEYHKGGMISVVKVKYDEIAAGGPCAPVQVRSG